MVKKQYFFFIFAAFISLALVKIAYDQQNQYSCANSKSCLSDLTEKIENNAKGVFLGQAVIAPEIDTNINLAQLPVLGESTQMGEKHIYVDLKKQTLYAYQGRTLVMKTLISSGKWGRTPAGNFTIWGKLRATRMAGGSGDDAYNLPNVPYVMYFYRDFGLHGAYWHNNFGHEMSHGCVNMRIIDAKTLFEWADAPVGKTAGTPVSVCNEIDKADQCIQNNPVQ